MKDESMVSIVAMGIAVILFIVCFPLTVRADDSDPDLSLGESGEEVELLEEPEELLIPDDVEVVEPPITDELRALFEEIGLLSIPENNDYPANAPLAGSAYIEATTSQLGTVVIYIPVDYQRGSLTYDSSGNLVNIRSGTITGFMYRGSTLYNIYWSAMQTPQYRLYSSGTYAALTVRSILNTNVNIVERNEDLPVVPNDEMYQLVIILLMGVMVFCLFMKRL